MSVVRKHIYFSGTVQGVGFRYRAMYTARMLGLTGWVKNLWDGRVEMEVQGDVNQIDDMIGKLEEGGFIQITGMEMAETQTDDRESSFRIVN